MTATSPNGCRRAQNRQLELGLEPWHAPGTPTAGRGSIVCANNGTSWHAMPTPKIGVWPHCGGRAGMGDVLGGRRVVRMWTSAAAGHGNENPSG